MAKLGGQLHEASQDHSPFDVVAWHGNHLPYRYDLADFSPVGSVRFDHPDPSIYTVLSAPLDEPGAHTLDLIVFPPRWDVSQGTFRPPYFHRNPVTEMNGIIRDDDPPPGSPFQPGCCFLTPSLTAHGPGGRAVERTRDTGRRRGRPARPARRQPVVPVRDHAAAVADPVGGTEPPRRLARHLGQPPGVFHPPISSPAMTPQLGSSPKPVAGWPMMVSSVAPRRW